MSERSKGVAERIKGPVVTLSICFNEDGSVDFPSVVKYVDWLCANGVPVISMATGASEFLPSRVPGSGVRRGGGLE